MSEEDLIREFTGPNASYYAKTFGVIQSTSKTTWTFNPAAMLFGSVWAGARGLSFLFLLLAFLDLTALGPLVQGLYGGVSSDLTTRVQQLEESIAKRRSEAVNALAAGNATKAATSNKLADNLQKAVEAARADVSLAAAGTTERLWFNFAALTLMHVATGFAANPIYERRYTAWRASRSLPHGLPLHRVATTLILAAAIYGITLYSLASAKVPDWLSTFPAAHPLYEATKDWLDAGFVAIYGSGKDIFDGLRNAIRILVETFESVLVKNPWPVVALVICTLAWQLAGWRIAVFTAAALAYLGLFGFWELSMQTVALLGAASILCIVFGIPLGIWFARSRTAFAFAQPILDLMQTMPAFVYLIPVIAFFGTGKPPGIIATVIFGMPPVIRLTTLGLRGVSEDVKEAARAYGATEWQVLKGVEIPLALPSILTGINQTILMCLSMVVIASLIGAQGLGSVVLESLQYAAKGQGLLAGLAILLCAMVIDRIVQGSFRNRD